MLWKVTDRPVHLMGSMHVMDGQPLILPPEMEVAYSEATRVVFETNPYAEPNPTLTVLSGDSTLSRIVPRDTFVRTRALWSKIGRKDPLKRIPPWLVGLSFLFGLAAQQGITTDAGIDRILWTRAKGHKITETLETPDAAIGVFINMPIDEQIKFLNIFVDLPDQAADGLRFLISCWRERDIGSLAKFLDQCLLTLPVFYGALIEGRNRIWLPHIQRMIGEDSPTLIVVGCLHCVGDTGLPGLLSESGYPITRVI